MNHSTHLWLWSSPSSLLHILKLLNPLKNNAIISFFKKKKFQWLIRKISWVPRLWARYRQGSADTKSNKHFSAPKVLITMFITIWLQQKTQVYRDWFFSHLQMGRRGSAGFPCTDYWTQEFDHVKLPSGCQLSMTAYGGRQTHIQTQWFWKHPL